MTAPDPRILPYGDAAIGEAAALIDSGRTVAVPTETVYGLAADAGDAAAVARIYAAKGRPSFNPLIVHVRDLMAAERLAIFDDRARDLARRFWPGPLTLVLPLRRGAPIASLVTAGLDTIAIRVPRHRAMQALLAATGKPLAAPSANRSNGLSPTRAAHVASSLGAAVPLIVDDGAAEAGVESTIVMDGRVLRPGPIPAHLVETRDGPGAGAIRPDAGTRLAPAPARIDAPGQLATHYAPAKPLRIDAVDARADEYLIGFGEIAGTESLSVAGDPLEAAAKLFDALHRADASAAASIAVAPIPSNGIGEAINDRLARAATR